MSGLYAICEECDHRGDDVRPCYEWDANSASLCTECRAGIPGADNQLDGRTTMNDAVSTPGRMPVINFSDGANHDTLTAALHDLEGWVFLINLKNGRQVTGTYAGTDDDFILVDLQNDHHTLNGLILINGTVRINLNDVVSFTV